MMRHHERPDVGAWYKNRELNSMFEVVASDEEMDCVEIQYFAGELEELDYETWYELDLRHIPPPDDWTGPFELSHDDIDYLDDAVHPEDWSNPLDEIEPD